MPARYDYTARQYEITCGRCRQSMGHTDSTFTEDPAIHQRIRFLRTQGRYHSECRDCERARRQRNPRPSRAARTATLAALGVGRRFGVEMELIFPRGTSHSTISGALRAAGLTGWNVMSDISLHDTTRNGGTGWEIVSPILAGEDGLDQIRTATRTLRSLGAKPNRTCGMHVHHEIRDLDLAAVKRLYRSWHDSQSMVDGLVAQSRRHGASESRFCRRIDASELAQVERARDLRRVAATGGKFKALNVSYLGSRGTIEIRQHQGTCDAEKVISWVRFGQALIDTAATQPTPVQPGSRMRDLMGALGERMDETARTFLLGRTLEFGAVPA